MNWAGLTSELDGDLVGLGRNRTALGDGGEAKASGSGFAQRGLQGFGNGVGSFGGQCPVLRGGDFGCMSDDGNPGSCREATEFLRSRTNRGFGGFTQRG